MTKPDIPGGDLLVQASCENDTTLQQTRQNIGGSQTLGEIHGGHTMSLVLGTRGELLETELCNRSLDLIRDIGMLSEAFGDIVSELAKSSVQGVNELGRRGCEVGGLVVLVILHDGEPVGDGGVIRAGWSLAVLEGLDGTAGGHDDAQAWRATDGFLGGCDYGIKAPLVELDLLRADGADTINDHEGMGADLPHQLCYALDI